MPKTPIVDAIRELADSGRQRWHTPGHKGEAPAPGDLPMPWPWDVTEVGSLLSDDSRHLVQDSERMLAEALGVRRSWYSVQGASLPVMAAILSAFKPGSVVAVERHAHRSVLAAFIIGGIIPHWINAATAPQGMVLPASLAMWERAAMESAGIVLTRPTYDGLALSGPMLGQLIQKVHALGHLVVVDEAHGAHWPGRAGFPQSAIEVDADLVAHGVHKTEPTLTQTGVLHLVSNRVDPEQVEWWWNLLSTSSPSFLLLASLDAWRDDRARPHVTRGWERLALEMHNLRVELAATGFKVWQQRAQALFDGDIDPAKLSVLGPGPPWAECLAEVGMVEKVEAGLISLIVAPGQPLDAIREGFARLNPMAAEGFDVADLQLSTPLPAVRLDPRQAVMLPMRWCPLREASGCIASRPVVPYPPGTPWIIPGEEITDVLVHQIVKSRSVVSRFWEGCRVIEGEVWVGVIAK